MDPMVSMVTTPYHCHEWPQMTLKQMNVAMFQGCGVIITYATKISLLRMFIHTFVFLNPVHHSTIIT